jgi:metallophosphoesterase (TIGR03767 family)
LSVSRRAFLRRLAAASAAASAAPLWDPVRAAASGRARMAAVTDPTGTTLELSIRRPEGSGFVQLVEAEPYPQIVREELAEAVAGREGRRQALASIVHLTDIHVVDAQSPGRVEFTDRLPSGVFGGAQRPQETMSVQVAAAMVERVNAVAAGPVTGRPFDVAVSTGDNIDNQQRNELEWFMTVLDGGPLTPNSGDPSQYEGVQDDSVGLGYYSDYWHPDPPPGANPPDSYKAVHGFPELPGLLDAAIGGFTTPGLDIPWYSTYGNHDGLLQGNAPGELPPALKPFDAVLTGSVKITAYATSGEPADLRDAVSALPGFVTDPTIASDPGLARVVTADAGRAAATVEDYIQRHLDSPASPGPVGHGYTAEMVAARQLYYTFDVSEAVLGISLDTVNHGGYADGSLGDAQLTWLVQQLTKAQADERLVVLFSHHNLYSLENPFPDPFAPEEPRRGFATLQQLLRGFPCVIAWVNGHSHVNRITPVADPTGDTGGFWEISTAAHIDWPEQARLVEVADNRDGTLSIFGTLIEHAAPASVSLSAPAAATPIQLASLSRTLSANEPQASMAALGAPGDRNVELLIGAPFTSAVSAPTPEGTDQEGGDGGALPATGIGSALTAATALGAAGAAALALRRRTDG